ncbi:mechanosensitive ion channel domain-containing protein [Microbacterium sp. 13-71-7]|jgi:small conductance mechanosensitive channel|uniref:mechanosensitive ion channel family protein n=1 Tax=Microbacterium sp. 13-71-7 TaxID=1970399 RepID=UPI000BC621F9|nr:mechanosensitive ion channel domain-containing protein [Microbacterium sp. 13-71-7]OZB83319.1 MAG: mechanosensitive ion channel protein MscS [Microbacterium sp. 13-71-7]
MNIVPLDTPSDIAAWWQSLPGALLAIGGKALQAALVIVICAAIAYALRFVIRRVVRRIVAGAKSKAEVTDTRALERSPLADMRLVQRTRTLGTILQNIVNVILVVVAIVLIVNIIDNALLGSLTLLTAAVGAGLGFGAQNIVKDVLNGMFLVAEDQVGIGDVVDLGLASGVVEYVSVRITQVRDANGTLWYVRNGEITRIGNMSQGWARAIIDLGVPADADVPAVEDALLAAAQGLAKDPKWRTRIVEKPEIWGLESIEGDALVIRVVMKTRTNAMDDVARELRMRLRDTMLGMELTVPSMATVQLAGPEGARRVHGANPPRTRPNPVATAPAVPERGFWRKKKTEGEKPATVTPPPRTKPAPTAPAPKKTEKPKTPPSAPQSLPLPPLPDPQTPQNPQNPQDPQNAGDER